MILSRKTNYSILALTRLVMEGRDGVVQISEIAKKEQIPQRYLENLFLELRKEGIVGSRLGKNGGYFLSRNPAEISLLEIIQLFEGQVGLLSCVSEKSYRPCGFCRDEETCRTKMVFREIRDFTIHRLKNATLDMLVGDDHKALEN
ncbi:MAG: Rrf2 family transcriptional regulator [Bacteroidales bacterium]|jgi:Rrf2 family protein|nr:Rrf2 family transcriptional regulator [Bacteroidales bacterium]